MSPMWASAFDRVVVIFYTPYRKEREQALRAELDRVGLGDAIFRWTYPSPFTVRFANAVPPAERLGNFDEMVMMYSELKVAHALGVERVLVLEDDVRFLRDLDLLRRSLERIPPDFVDLKLSWIQRGGPVKSGSLAGGDPWVPTTGVVTRDTGAIAFSREGMEWFTECTEAALGVNGGRLTSCDLLDRPPHYKENGARHYLAVPLLARQVQFRGRMSGIQLSDYYEAGGCLAPGGCGAYSA